jgi:hypothetical protein
MALMDDYSGPFEPMLDHEHFSREGLLKLVKCYQQCYLLILGEYGRVLRERLSLQEAMEWDISMWMVAGPKLAETVCKFMNINPAGIEGYLKRRQLDPGMQLTLIDMTWELVNDSLAHMTINKNPDYLAEPTDARLQVVRNIECSTAQVCAFFHDPNIVFIPTKLPPARNDSEPCFVMEVKKVQPSENPYPSWTGKNVKLVYPHDPAEYRRPWSEQQIRTVWTHITKDLRDVLREIATQPGGYEESQLLETLGVSVERATYLLNFVPLAVFESPWPNKHLPVRLHPDPMRYEMDSKWAETLTGGADWVNEPY